MYGVMWREKNADRPSFADVACADEAQELARALVAAGHRGVAYWHIDGRTATSAEMDHTLAPTTLEETKVSRT